MTTTRPGKGSTRPATSCDPRDGDDFYIYKDQGDLEGADEPRGKGLQRIEIHDVTNTL